MREHVLVAIDDDDVRQIVAAILTDAGYTVQGAATSTAAAAMVARRWPDVVVADAEVVWMDAALQDLLRGWGPLVLLTADPETLPFHGATLVRVPFALGDLVRAVDSALNRRHRPSRRRT